MYTPKFERLPNLVPRVDEKGKDIAESTRINMALFIWNKLEDGCKLMPILGELHLVEPMDHMTSRVVT